MILGPVVMGVCHILLRLCFAETIKAAIIGITTKPKGTDITTNARQNARLRTNIPQLSPSGLGKHTGSGSRLRHSRSLCHDVVLIVGRAPEGIWQ